MSTSPNLIETKIHTEKNKEERKRYQFRDKDGEAVLGLDTINEDEYASNWHVPFDVEGFEELVKTNYANPSLVETEAVYCSSEDELGEKLISTYERVTSHDRHPHDCVYIEFNYGPHVLSWNAEHNHDNGGQLSVSVEGDDTEPLNRFFQATVDLPEDDIRGILESAETKLHENIS